MRFTAHFLVVLLFFVGSCKKDEQIVIENNTAPPDYTIATAIKDDYINKVYISILGREPDSLEFSAAQLIVNQNNISVEDREQLLSDVLEKPDYYDRTYQIARSNLLNGLDTAQITQYIGVFDVILADTVNKPFWPQVTYEKNRLEDLKKVPVEFETGVIDMIGVYKRCIDNYFYDQINMGTENFVVSMFQNFLFRYPTTAELSQASAMVDGQPSTIFLQSGKNKTDFINIFFSANYFFEGQVKELYKRYLFRDPTSEEMTSKAVLYKTTLNYKGLQKDILVLDEYVGIKK